MKKLSLLLLLVSIFGFGQTEKRPIQGFYFSPEVSAGFNLSNIIQGNRDRDNNPYNPPVNYPNDFSYGISAVTGFNFIPNLSLGGGLKYTYTTDNFHIVYGIIQPKILFNVDDGEPVFIDLTYGFQLNKSVVENSDLFGIKVGKLVSHSKRLSQQGGLYFEGQQLGNTGVTFVGLFYGLTIFSNKNYNEYGKD
ncbi:hypothetical protein Q73A0000_04750 [Kaistella flava (ex Peng et al. 2021)]|uniref:Outer membrane protein beta-barrel domain-containing protein n=1 Tax=Kaistella flava (ex Peng et al. 2021) TaxID=2038776 RepID=A0A7M2Y8K1_9FLAO|nr:hypothetical protein [Kaistella flava (ex Peng et al. 2021)]QOW09722.1 hypothetical protein Q73A0000_04750 [Kaistella flava (ex Peng et al. 2021)]